MPAHRRTQVRDKVVSLLLNKTSAGSRVEDSPVYPVFTWDELPYIGVFTPKERPGDVLVQTPVNQREMVLELSLALVLKNKDNYQTALDAFMQQVELLLGNNLDGLVEKIEYVGFDVNTMEAEEPILVGTLNYEVTYIHEEGGLIDEATLPDLLRVFAEWDLGADGTVNATDNIGDWT